MSKLNNLSCFYQISQVILLVGNDNSAINEFKSNLKSAFKLWDIGPANYFFFLGLRIHATTLVLGNIL